ncbi:adenylate kinase [Verrucomicrobium sp. BvORR106]|uniref:adenylate kinase n=1 Tax=Verrucomicrobium sp. BvORR106 TaxID=1403819 RepID=UPI000A76FF6F|nr:adenylate kinase [Verrucomicrobium sp. BvORR106]
MMETRDPKSESLLRESAVPRRINVIGASGSGKSTFARRLADQLRLPCVEMDSLFWGANWHKATDEQFFARVQTAVNEPGWVLDGNYTRTIPIKWAQVELVVWLDYPFHITMWQAIKRALRRAWSKEEIWPGTGNRESFRQTLFSKDSMIWWTLTTHGKVRAKYEAMLADSQFTEVQFVRLRSHAEAAAFIERWKCLSAQEQR